MRKIISFACFTLLTITCLSQTKIHSHNDYERQRPFFEAYEAKVAIIEVDIFLVGDSLIVAHGRQQINVKNTLNKLYLNPIASFYKQFNNKVSADQKYTFSLMIDVKDDWNVIYPILKREIEKYGIVFNRSKNKCAIQIVISGNRPQPNAFHSYPKWLFFDGLPNINYTRTDFKRVSMISDKFSNYTDWSGEGNISKVDKLKLQAAVKKANYKNRDFRFWGAPDTKDSWIQLIELGNVIINTDKIKEYILMLTANK